MDDSATRLDFAARVAGADPRATSAEQIEWLMLNVGLKCNQSCSHCHHRCGPSRPEVMDQATMLDCLSLAKLLEVRLLDVTGGAPELWPLLPQLVRSAYQAGLAVRLRTNLSALLVDDTNDLATLLATHGVTILASLPGTTQSAVDAQRGVGCLERSLVALRQLAQAGYGQPSGPVLEIAYNAPAGEIVPPDRAISADFEALLGYRPAVVRTITNVPLGRFADALEHSGEQHAYLHRLADAFNPTTVARLACRSGLEVAWDGRLYDCDFNLAAQLPVSRGPLNVTDALAQPHLLAGRPIAFGHHCFACTADRGSS